MTISVVTFKTNLDILKKCLDSLTSNTINKIYLIDNAKDKDTEIFTRKYKGITYVPMENVGYGAANNWAIKQAAEQREKYHLVINPDVYFEPKVLDRLVAYMDSHEDVALVQPNVLYPDGRPQYTCRLLPEPKDLIFRRFMPVNIGRERDDRYTLRFWDHKTEENIPYYQGAFMLFRVKCVMEVGLFDERFFMYPEDIDITRRLHRKWKTMFYPYDSIVHMHHQESYKSMKMLRIHVWNMIKYFNKWGWLNDKERNEWNKDLLKHLNYKKRP